MAFTSVNARWDLRPIVPIAPLNKTPIREEGERRVTADSLSSGITVELGNRPGAPTGASMVSDVMADALRPVAKRGEVAQTRRAMDSVERAFGRHFFDPRA